MARGETRLERLTYRWCGLAVLVGVVVGLMEVHGNTGPDGLRELGVHAATSLIFVGKFIIFAGLHDDTPSPWVLAMMVWLIDLLFAFALASGLKSLERAPVFGRWMRRARGRAIELVAGYPGLERMAFFGVVFLVMLPLAATGAITGSFAARLFGLTRVGGVLAIAIGSAVTALSFALLADFLGERAEEIVRSPILAGLSLVALALIGRMAWRRIRGRLRA